LIDRAPLPHIKYLSEEKYYNLTQYKHHAPKTPYENFMLDKVTIHVEKALPKSWTANTITIIGNLMLYVAAIVCLTQGGLSYVPTEHS